MTENRKTKKEKCFNEKMDNEDGRSQNLKKWENIKSERRKVSNEKTVTDNVYGNIYINSIKSGN